MKFTTIAIISLLALTACRGPRGDEGSNGQTVVGPTGPTGAIGGVGATGPQGNSGAPGIDGTQITVVDLCPGVTAYPGVFVEVGMCIEGKLYGVYSANNGFLTYLADGAYSSNAIGSACNLTITGCTVTH